MGVVHVHASVHTCMNACIFTYQFHSLLLCHVPNHHGDISLGIWSLGLEICQGLTVLLDHLVSGHHSVSQELGSEKA